VKFITRFTGRPEQGHKLLLTFPSSVNGVMHFPDNFLPTSRSSNSGRISEKKQSLEKVGSPFLCGIEQRQSFLFIKTAYVRGAQVVGCGKANAEVHLTLDCACIVDEVREPALVPPNQTLTPPLHALVKEGRQPSDKCAGNRSDSGDRK
jgi:hypothetical protein